jgi:hypothetical protein
VTALTSEQGKWQEESSFFEKKEAKKLFPYDIRWWIEPALNGRSFFASFCSQKEDSSFPLPASINQ